MSINRWGVDRRKGGLNRSLRRQSSGTGNSADIDSHPQSKALRLHHAVRGADGAFARADEILEVANEPDH